MTIGSAQGDMIIDDPGIAPSHIRIEVTPQGPAVVNLVPNQPATLNGQPLGPQAVALKANDSLLVGSTTIFFNRIDASMLEPPGRWHNESADNRLHREGSREHAILQALDFLARKAGAADIMQQGEGDEGGNQAPPPPPAGASGGAQPPPLPGQSGAAPPVPPPVPGKPQK